MTRPRLQRAATPGQRRLSSPLLIRFFLSVCLAGRGLDLEWGLGLLVEVQVACLGEEPFPLLLHDLVNICGVEFFSLAIVVKRLCAVDVDVEQEACIERLQELQDVLPILGRPLIQCDVWGLLRLYDGHEA